MAYARAEQVDVGEDQVAIAITHGTLGSHLGVAYRNGDDAAKLFHLEFHRRLAIDDYPRAEWLAACVPIDDVAGAQIVALLDGAAKLYPSRSAPGSYDYGIALLTGAGSIAPDGAYSPKDGCDGFTCSSIVAEIFRSFGFPLVDLSNWPNRPINRAWGQAIVCMLDAYGAGPEHVQAVERNISELRLRPEEVAAAAEQFRSGHPALFPEVEARAEEVMAQVRAECAAPPPIPAHHPMAACVVAFQNAVVAAAAAAPGIDGEPGAQASAQTEVADAQANPKDKPATARRHAVSRWRRLSPKLRKRRGKKS